MWVLLLLLVALGFITAFLEHRRGGRVEADAREHNETPVEKHQENTTEACQTCAADGIGCYAERILRHAARPAPLYFDDEELDQYKGVAENDYTHAQTEEFADVLHTLNTEEISDWLHSLSQRGIALPQNVRDEAILLLQG